ncbi:MAG: protein-S-isoprenylcysteine O-methyltransferase [Pseudomonadota bacterium]
MKPQLLKLIPWIIFLGFGVLIVLRVDINGVGSIIWFINAILISVIRAPFEKTNKANVVTEKRAVSAEKALLFGVFFGGSLLPVLHLGFGLFAFANYSLPLWSIAIALILLVGGLFLFYRSHADLGRNWSVTTEIREDHTLVTEGVYQRIRHPMYSAIWLFFIAQPLLVQNWIAGLSGIVAFGLMYFARIRYEEQMMHDQFGADYKAYVARTGRVFPKFG